jgi:hypothetical protein
MSDPVEEICDDLTTTINGLELSLTVFATQPVDALEELKLEHPELQAIVWPFGQSDTKISRGGGVLEVYQASVYLVRMITVEFTRERLAAFTRELLAKLRGQRMAGHVWSGDEIFGLFNLSNIHTIKHFMAEIRISYTACS